MGVPTEVLWHTFVSKILKRLQLTNMSLLKIPTSTTDPEMQDSHSANDTEEDAKLTLIIPTSTLSEMYKGATEVRIISIEDSSL